MIPQRIAGLILLVIGMTLLIFGVNATQKVADSVTETFTGRYTDTTMGYIVGGIALALVGALFASMGAGRPRRA